MRDILGKCISVVRSIATNSLLKLVTVGYTWHQVRSADFPPEEGGQYLLQDIIRQCNIILDQNSGKRYLTSNHLALVESLLASKQGGILNLRQFGDFKTLGSCFIPVNPQFAPPLICYVLQEKDGSDALFFWGGLYALPLLLIHQRCRRLVVFHDSYLVQPKCPEIEPLRLIWRWRKKLLNVRYASTEDDSSMAGNFNGNIFCMGFSNNFGHYLWNELSGLYDLITSGMLKRGSKIIVGPYDFCDVAHIMQEHYGMVILPAPKKFSVFSSSEAEGVFFRFNDIVVSDAYCQYLKQKIFFSAKIPEDPAKKILNVCMKIRCHNRVCENQGEILGQLIQYFLERFPAHNVCLFIDGFSRYRTMTSFDEEMISIEKEYLAQLFNKFDTQWSDRVEVIDMIGMTVREKAEIAAVLDLYLSPVGSGGELYNWVYKVPSIYYGVPCMMALSQRHAQGIVESLPWIGLVEARPSGGKDESTAHYYLDPSLLLAALHVYCDKREEGKKDLLEGISYFSQRSEQ